MFCILTRRTTWAFLWCHMSKSITNFSTITCLGLSHHGFWVDVQKRGSTNDTFRTGLILLSKVHSKNMYACIDKRSEFAWDGWVLQAQYKLSLGPIGALHTFQKPQPLKTVYAATSCDFWIDRNPSPYTSFRFTRCVGRIQSVTTAPRITHLHKITSNVTSHIWWLALNKQCPCEQAKSCRSLYIWGKLWTCVSHICLNCDISAWILMLDSAVVQHL